MTPARRVLAVALLALATLYAAWFANDPHRIAAWLVFALPPLLLGLGVLRGLRTAGFWAGTLSLGWFSHAVVVLYERPAMRGWGLAELVLALAILFAASLPGLRARFAAKRTPRA